MNSNSKGSNIWGGRFTKSLDPLAVTFNASISFDYKLAYYDIWGSQIHAEMLGKQEIITKKEAEQLISGLEKIKNKVMHGEVIFSNDLEDIHMNIENLLLNEVGDVAKKLHTARSRNDQVALDLRLYLRAEIKEILLLLENSIRSLKFCQQKYVDILLPGYTHLQRAQPIKLENYFGAYISMFSRDLTRLEDCLNRLNFCPLGAGALAGTDLPIDRAYVAEKLQFKGTIENTIDAVSDRDFVMEFLSVSSIIMTHLSRFSEDIIIWASEEFSFVKLDDAFATGSSLMPNKKNPDIPELIRGKCGRVFGNLVGILSVMKALPLGYNKDLQEDKESLFDTVDTIKSCLQIFSPFLTSLSFQVENMQNATKNSFIWATKLLEELVKNKVPFRDAHECIGKIILYCIESNKNFSTLNKKECDLFSPYLYSSILKLSY
ncbi:argininosuccinate lyase [Pigmentibacter sp. JX0631]|uniref:argininosuccinate lyase n=1 Tax=Pigmentibacter sp. JX0631 TaxID=2976982 RepID=UPI00246943F9|nr:argininosuccinate lyase [Pigmentibacter sp. JX0631]WGL59233.1 argininosuccinate lyase [Pigmentibacter sp. JX0631]